jgi:predicted nucleotidyltransferase
MSGKRRTSTKAVRGPKLYFGADVPMRVIRRFARQVAERFEPEKIILFGSHAYGTPHADSDVDILVVMPARNQHDQAFKIREEVDAPFPMDLIVRTPANLKWRLAEGESFSTEIVTMGKVLYEKIDVEEDAERQERVVPRRAWDQATDRRDAYPTARTAGCSR